MRDSFEIEIKPNWITSAYYVYVVTIIYNENTYLYIGQTGDNNYHSARAPLYRIGGHFAKGTSTENQIIKYFKETVLAKQEIGAFELEQKLKDSKLNYKFWSICDFDPNDSKEKHTEKRMKAQAVEHYLIFKLQEDKNLTVLNSIVKEEFSKSKQKHFDEKGLSAIGNDANKILKEFGYEG